jgi:hypothetical protein
VINTAESAIRISPGARSGGWQPYERIEFAIACFGERMRSGEIDRLLRELESLLPWHERIAMVRVLHGTLVHVHRDSDVMMRTDQQADAFAAEPLSNRLDFGSRCLLFGQQVIEPEHEQKD